MKNDGGQAFPRNYAHMNPEAGKSELASHKGMTMRQWYKGMALHNPATSYLGDPVEVSKLAGDLADALLAEDEKFENKGKEG